MLLIGLQVLDIQVRLSDDIGLPDHVVVIELTCELLLIRHMHQAPEVLIPDWMQRILLHLGLELVLGSRVQPAHASLYMSTGPGQHAKTLHALEASGTAGCPTAERLMSCLLIPTELPVWTGAATTDVLQSRRSFIQQPEQH